MKKGVFLEGKKGFFPPGVLSQVILNQLRGTVGVPAAWVFWAQCGSFTMFYAVMWGLDVFEDVMEVYPSIGENQRTRLAPCYL